MRVNQTCFEQDSTGKLTDAEICNEIQANCNASAWKTHYENFHGIQLNNIVSQSLGARFLFVINGRT
jgi:hypothetical protein